MNEEEHYCVRWKGFHTNIVSALEHLKSDEEFVDVTLSCEGQRIQGHKVILSASSTYFRKILKDNPCRHPVLILNDIPVDVMEAIVTYMYHGTVSVPQHLLKTFLKTAEALRIKGIVDYVGENEGEEHQQTSAAHAAANTMGGVGEQQLQIAGQPANTLSEFHQARLLLPSERRRNSTASSSGGSIGNSIASSSAGSVGNSSGASLAAAPGPLVLAKNGQLLIVDPLQQSSTGSASTGDLARTAGNLMPVNSSAQPLQHPSGDLSLLATAAAARLATTSAVSSPNPVPESSSASSTCSTTANQTTITSTATAAVGLPTALGSGGGGATRRRKTLPRKLGSYSNSVTVSPVPLLISSPGYNQETEDVVETEETNIIPNSSNSILSLALTAHTSQAPLITSTSSGMAGLLNVLAPGNGIRHLGTTASLTQQHLLQLQQTGVKTEPAATVVTGNGCRSSLPPTLSFLPITTNGRRNSCGGRENGFGLENDLKRSRSNSDVDLKLEPLLKKEDELQEDDNMSLDLSIKSKTSQAGETRAYIIPRQDNNQQLTVSSLEDVKLSTPAAIYTSCNNNPASTSVTIPTVSSEQQSTAAAAAAALQLFPAAQQLLQQSAAAAAVSAAVAASLNLRQQQQPGEGGLKSEVKHEGTGVVNAATPTPDQVTALLTSDQMAALLNPSWKSRQPRMCQYCQRMFSNKFNLKQHILNMHTVGREMQCEICNKKVKNKWYLRRHHVTHHGAPLKK